MSTLFRWPGFDPLRLMQRELERLPWFEFGEARTIGGGAFPPVNVLSSPEEMLVEMELPGVKRDDIDLSITGETLVVKGSRKLPDNSDKLTWQRQERGVGDFVRTISLGDRVDASKVDAKLADGILTIRLPKAESARPKQIKVG